MKTPQRTQAAKSNIQKNQAQKGKVRKARKGEKTQEKFQAQKVKVKRLTEGAKKLKQRGHAGL